MATSLLEVTRSKHEEIERLERLIVEDLQTQPRSSKDKLVQSHRVRHMIESIMLTTEKLVETYENKDGARGDEIAALGGQTVFSAFYDRLKEIRYNHHPSRRTADSFNSNQYYEALLKEEPVVRFSGEEGSGRYLDLHDMYNQYINSKFGQRIDYSAYLDVFSQPENIPRKLKVSSQYMKYLDALLEYLIYFFKRTEPLKDLDRMLLKVEDGKVGGFENHELVPSHPVIDLDYYTTVEELIDVGPEKLKEALGALGLKVGGTLQQRAERLFLTKHTPLEKLNKNHFSKATQESESAKEIAIREAKVKKLCDLLGETIERTKQNVVRKQTMRYEEIEEEREGEEANAESESDDEDGQIYNPLKLPMGWDGKPIPYWLYKLHGLGQEFKCEICGNYSYWGRRAFERHFRESRHQHGMLCLGIPNTNNFNEITSIEEAKELWKSIQNRQEENKWRPDLGEECEDGEGNPYNKKIYSDLKRQGLI